MPTIEQRVVEMRFDNQQFEKGAKDSINTIDKLNKSLDFDEAEKSLNKLSNAGNKFSLKGMEVALSSITEKFSALEIAGITAIQNLTTRGMAMTERFVKSVSIDQVTSGWDKYAQKTSAVQTIMSATAKDFENTEKQMESVNAQIEKLNWFTDETSYSLLDMTSNIGKFTSNGIKLEDATKQMEGISVWASLSGASISDAGRAMYNLSQAMASGTVKSIDWMSIENANMATREFKEAAIEAAVAQGALIKTSDGYTTAAGKAVDVTKDFKGTLSEGWFNKDVLGATLNRFGAFTEELHDFIDATGTDTASEAVEYIERYIDGELSLTELSKETGVAAEELKRRLDILSSSEMELGRRAFKAAQEAKTFQEALDSVKEAVASGWMNSFELIFGNYNEAKTLWTDLANEMYDVFATSGNIRNDILSEWHDAETGGYEDFIEGLHNLWEGIKNISAPIVSAFKEIFDPLSLDSDDGVGAKAQILKDFTVKFKDWTASFKDYIGNFTEPIRQVMKPVEEVAETATKTVGKIAKTKEVLDELANATIRGDYGNGDDRRRALEELGYSYELVQNRVNELLGPEWTFRYEIDETEESVTELSDKTEVLADKMADLQNIGSDIPVLTEADQRAQTLRKAFLGLFKAANFVVTIFKGIGRVLSHTVLKLFKALEPVIWGVAGAIGDFISEIERWLAPIQGINGVFDTMISIIDTVIDKFVEFGTNVWQSVEFEKLRKAFGKLKVATFEVLQTFFHNVGEIKWADVLKEALDKVGELLEFVANHLASFVDYLANHKNDVINFFSQFKISDTDIANAGTALENLYNVVKNFGSGVLDDVKDAFSRAFGKSSELGRPDSPINTIATNLSNAFSNIWEAVTNFDSTKAANIFKNSGLVIGIGALASIAKGFKNVVENFSDLPGKFLTILDSYSKQMNATANDKNANALLKLAKAIGIFAGALFVLSLVRPDQLNNAVSALVVVMGMVALIMNIVAKMKQAKAEATVPATFADKIVEPLKNFLTGIQGIAKKFAEKAGIAALLIGFALAVGLLGFIIGRFSKIDWDSFLDGVGKVLIVSVILVSAAAILNTVGENISGKTAAALIGLSVAIWLLMAPINALKDVPIDQLKQAIEAISVLMGMMGIFNYLSKDTSGWGAVGAVALAGALNLLVKPVIEFYKLNPDRLKKSIFGIGLLASIIGLLGVAVSQDGDAPTALLKLAIAMGILAIPLMVIGKNAEVAAGGLLILAGGMAVLVIGAALADKFAVGLALLGHSMKEFGLGALFFGGAVALIAAAIYLVAKAFPLIIDGLVHLGKAIKYHGEELAIGIGALLVAIAGAILLASPAISGAIVGLLTNIAGAIVGALPIFTSHLGLLIGGVLVFFYTIIPSVANAILDIIVQLINSLADGIRNHAAPIFHAIGNLLDSAWDLIVEFFASIFELVPVIGKDLAAETRKAKDWVTYEIDDMGKDMEDSFRNSLDFSDSANATNVSGSFRDFINEADVETPAAEKGEEGATSLIDSFLGRIQSGDGTSSAIPDALTSILGDASIEDAMKQCGIDITSFTVDGMTQGTEEGTEDVQDAIVETVDNANQNSANTNYENSKVTGAAIDNGIADGVRENASTAYTAVDEVNGEIIRRSNNTFEVHSPSRVAARLGRFWDLGLADGLIKNASEIEDGADVASNTLISSMNGVIAKISDILSDDMDTSPTITPVLNLDDMTYGLTELDRMTAARSIDIAGRIGNVANPRQQLLDKLNALDMGMMTINGNLATAGDASLTVNVPLYMDSKKVGHATANVVNTDIERMQRNAMRRAGKR